MGVNFSALNLQITETGGQERLKTLDAIDQRVSKMSDTSRAAFAAMSKQEQEAFLRWESGAKAATISTDKATASVARATVAIEGMGVAARQSAVAVTQVAVASDSMNVRGARATQGIARGFEMVARTGALTGRSLDAVLSDVSQLALGFGPTGVLVGAIGIATAAIVELFMRTKREMEEARKKFEEETGKMANAGRAMDLQRQAQAVLYGNPYDEKGKPNELSAAAPGAYTNSLADLQARLAQVAAKIPANATMAPRDIAEEYNSLSRQIDVLAAKYNQLATAARNVKNVASDMPGLLPFVTSAAKAKPLTDAERQKAMNLLWGAIDHNDLLAMGVQTSQRYGSGIPQVDHKGLITAAKLPLPSPSQEDADRLIQRFNQIAESAGQQMAATLGRTLSAGFTELFARGGGGKNMFKAMTSAFLEGLGEMFMAIGEKFLAGLSLIATIKHAIESFLPEVGIPGAIALIALGAALKGAGSRAGSASVGSGGGGYSYSGAPVASGPIIVNPSGASATSSIAGMQARANIIVNANILSPQDPTWQRQLTESIRLAARRVT